MRTINGIKFTKGEMDAIWHALDHNASHLDTCILVYRKPEHKKWRKYWRKQAADSRSAQQKFWRVSVGITTEKR